MKLADGGSLKDGGTFTVQPPPSPHPSSPRRHLAPFGRLVVLRLICVRGRTRGTLGGCGRRVGRLLCQRAHLQEHLSVHEGAPADTHTLMTQLRHTHTHRTLNLLLVPASISNSISTCNVKEYNRINTTWSLNMNENNTIT